MTREQGSGSVLAGIAGVFMVYILVEALRTGELKGRHATYRKETDPGTYWFGICVLLIICGGFAYTALWG